MINNKRHNYLIILMFVAATALISLCLPRNGKTPIPSYEQGKPWLNPMLIAPFDFTIMKSDEEAKAITDSIKENFKPIYRRDDASAMEQIEQLGKDLAGHNEAPYAVRQQLLHDVTQAYEDGIVDNLTSEQIGRGALKQVRILGDNSVAQLVSTEKMKSIRHIYEKLDSTYDKRPGSITNHLNISEYLTANIVIDEAETNKLMNDQLNDHLGPTGMVQTGEAIIFTGNIVTPQKYIIIKSLEQELKKKAEQTNTDENLIFLGKILLVAIIMLMYCYFLIAMRYRVYANLRSMVFLVCFMTLFTVSVFLIESLKASYLYLIPFAIVPIIISTFFDVRIAFFTHIVVVLICSLVADEQAQFIIMQFLAGCIAIASMQELTRRSQLVTCALLIFVAYSATYMAIYLSRGGNLESINWHQFLFYGINCVALSFAYVGIFVVEKLFGFTSLVTLVELSDITNPLLRRLSERCPGTFQHSLQVANIAAEAAIKVGASQQLVRAGALYHDIGKTANPAFFTENQSGVNPHNGLPYEDSAAIVIGHVTDGIRIADKARLPQVIKDLIIQHHGTSTARYFYTQACQEAGNTPVDATAFTYPGPRPQSKEAAILMMADACEAAARSLQDYSEKSIAALVDKIIDGQIASGQLKDAPISFKQVGIVKEVFVERLKTFYHTRIAYPEEAKQTQHAN